MSKETLTNIRNTVGMVLLVIAMLALVGFTIYLETPDDVEINQISYAGREIIKSNNKLAFDLFAWAPGYTDQAIIQVDNNTIYDMEYSIKLKLPKNVPEELIENIGVYVKKNPGPNDVLARYDSVITDGYKYVGTLSYLKEHDILVDTITNEHTNYSIIFHVSEDAKFSEINYTFTNILTVETPTITKTFE